MVIIFQTENQKWKLLKKPVLLHFLLLNDLFVCAVLAESSGFQEVKRVFSNLFGFNATELSFSLETGKKKRFLLTANQTSSRAEVKRELSSMGLSTCVTDKIEAEIKTNMDIFITDISPTEWFPLNTNAVQIS